MSKEIIENYFDLASKNYKSNNFNPIHSFIKQKEKNIFLEIINNIKINNKVILDLGGGTGFYSKIILKRKPKKIVAIDFSKRMLSHIKNNKIKKIYGDVNKLKIKGNFDLIICMGLLEFLKKFQMFIKKIKILSKKGSYLIMLVPQKNFFGLIYKFYYLFIHNLNINLFSIKELETLLVKNRYIIINRINIFPSSIMLLAKKK